MSELDFVSFDEYLKIVNSIWVVSNLSSDMFSATSTCPFYLKNDSCKHILGLAIRLKYCEPPVQAKKGPLGTKRKRGRPALAKKALLTQ